MRKNIKNRFKELGVLTTIGLMGLSLSSCGSTKEATTEATTAAATVDNTTEDNKKFDTTATTENVTEATTEATTEAVQVDVLDINNNLSIEYAVDTSYSKYEEFYKNNGISKDQVRDMIFVANDLYTDEDGKLVIDEDRAIDAYMNINKILFSGSIRQKLDNINTELYIGNKIDDTITIEAHPLLEDFIDSKIPGADAVINEIKEYEKLRDSQIKKMNSENMYDYDQMEKYVIKNEYTDINNYANAIDSVSKNGHKYILAEIHSASLNMTAVAGVGVEYINVPENNNRPTIKINPTDGERDLEAEVITLMQEGFISEQTYNDVVTKARVYAKLNKDTKELEEELAETYDISIKDTNLIVRYGIYLQSMAQTGYDETKCDEQNETKQHIQAIRSKTTSLNFKRLTLKNA